MIRRLVCLSLLCTPCLLFAQEENSSNKLVSVRIAILESNGDLPLKEGDNLSVDGLNALISNLREQNPLERYQFFKLASLENQQAKIQVGRNQPVVTGRNLLRARGPGAAPRYANVYQEQRTGSIIEITPRVRDDGQIVLELSIESSRLVEAPPSEAEEEDPVNAISDFSPPTTKTLTCRTTVLLQSGVGTVIAGGREDSDAEATRTYIVVTATAK